MLESRVLLTGIPLSLSAVNPAVSQVFSSQVVLGSLAGPAQTNEYEVTLGANDTLTVAVSPRNPSLVTHLTVTSPGVSPTTVTAGGANQPAILQTLATAGGTYTISATNVAGAGDYAIQAVVNAAVEAEQQGGPANDSIATAQSLDGRVSLLPGGLGGQRFAVLGQTGSADPDYYQLSLDAGQLLSLAVEGINTRLLQIELLDGAGNVLAVGGRGADSVDAWINGYAAPSTGDYFVRVTNAFTENYALLGTIDAQLALEPDEINFSPQTLTPGVPMLGHLGDGAGASTSGGPTGYFDLFSEPNDTGGDSAYVDFEEYGTWEGQGEIGDNFDLFDLSLDIDIVEIGYLYEGTIFTADLDSDELGYGLDGLLRLFDSSGNEVARSDDDPAPGESPSLDPYLEYQIDFEEYFYLGISGYSNDQYELYGDYPPDGSGGGGGEQGYYELTLSTEGVADATDDDAFVLRVNPGDAVNVSVVALDPAASYDLTLLDENGSVVGSATSDGGGQAVVSFDVPGDTAAGAAYRVQIAGLTENRSAYVLRADGATAAASPAIRFLSLPVKYPDQLPDYVSYPTFVDAVTTANIDPASVELGDLVITGPAGESLSATSVQVIDGFTVRYQILGANIGSGDYTLTIADDAFLDLNGNGLTGSTRTFTYRQEGPRVVSSTLANNAVLSPGGLTHTVEFSEPLLQFVSAGLFGYIVLTAEDVELKNLITNEIRNPINFSYTNSPTPRITATFAQLDEGVYELRYLATDRSEFGEIHISGEDFFPLDGSPSGALPSGDGDIGDDFVLNFTVDRPTDALLPPFVAVGPEGGQVYTHDPVGAAIGDATDIDTFTFNADAGQTLSLQYNALDPSLQGRVRVLDPGGAVLADVSAAAASAGFVEQPINLAVGGTYRIEVTGLAGIGGYQIQTTLNALLQTPGNDSAAAAQSLAGSALAVGNDGGQRLAVTGQVAGDIYTDSQTITGTAFAPNLLTYRFDRGPDAVGPVTLSFQTANLSLFNENQFFEVDFEGLSGQNLFVTFSNNNPTSVTLSAEQWKQLTADGTATVRLKPSAAVTGTASSALTVGVTYATAADADFYRIYLAAGQSLDLAARSGNAGGVALSLQNAAGQTLAASINRPGDGQAGLSGFVASAAGEYFVRVVGQGEYTLIATAGAQFDQEPQTSAALSTSAVLGSLAGSGVAGRTLNVAHLGATSSSGGSGNDPLRLVKQLNDSTAFGFNAVRVTAADLATAEDFARYDVIVTGGIPELNSDKAFAARLRNYVESGGGFVLVGDAPFQVGVRNFQMESVDVDAIAAIQLAATRVSTPNNINILDNTHPITAGLNDFAPGFSTVTTDRGARGKADTVVLGQSGGRDTVAYRLLGQGGRSVYLGSVYDADFNNSVALRSGAPDQLLEQAVAWAAEAGDRVDGYTLDLSVGQTVTLETALPAAGPNDPANNLDPAIRLLGPDGQVVAADSNGLDGRNARLTYTVPAAAAGRYTVEVIGETSASGSYVLSVAGANLADTAGPSVVAASPADGQRYAQPPTQFTLTFDEALDLSTVDASDLTLDNGATVTGVEIVDGQTLRFLINVPDMAGAFSFSFAAGGVTDLAGNGNAAFGGSFNIDRTGPRVIAQTPGTQAAAPFNTLSLTFDEPLDPDTVSIADLSVFTSPGGTNLIPAVTSIFASGNQLTVNFADQFELGTYTLTLLPTLTNAVGLAMDQDQDGTAGETADDAYTATFAIQSPNLTVESVTPAATAGVFGSTFDLSYTVRNNGSDAAVEGWIDRIYLSTDGVFNSGDRLLREISAADQTPLAAGASYTRNVTLTLPLLAALDAGSYQLLVVTDATLTQPEDSETDNLGTTGPLDLTLPPLPDLTVSQITLPPSPQPTGSPLAVSWTVSNLGDGDAAGTIYNDIYLSRDANLVPNADVYVGRFAFAGTIPAAGSINLNQLINIPIQPDGDYYVIIKTDASNTFFEHNDEGNNVTASAAPIRFEYPALPDLVVSDIIAPASALSNELVTVSWTITNNGTADFVGTFTDRVSLSADTLVGGDQPLGTFVFDGAIAAGQSITRSANVKLPAELSGNRYIVVETDTTNRVFENLGEANNAAVDDTPMLVSQDDFPNLVVTLVNVPPVVFSGQGFDVTWRVTNIGNAPTSAANWSDRVFLSTNGVIDGLDSNLGSIATPAFLNPGESYEQTLSVTVPDGVQGPRYVLVLADATNRVFELNDESDNVGVSPLIDVQLTPPPDLQVVNVDAPPAAFSGQGMTLRWTVRNEGLGDTRVGEWTDRVWLSADESLDGFDIELGSFKHNGVLGAGASYRAEHVVGLPVGLTGDFFFIVQTDRYDQVFEFAFEVNNLGVDTNPTTILLTPPPDLAVTSITAPTAGEAGRNITVGYVVENEGATDTPNESWTDLLYLSANGVFDPAQNTLLATQIHRDPLAPGETYTSSFTARLPDGINGPYTLFVVTDQLDAVFELDNDNNIVAAAAPLQVALTPPDLVVTATTLPEVAVAGSGTPLSFTVTNLGIGDTTTNRWTDRVFLSSDGELIGARPLTTFTRFEALDAGDSYNVNLVLNVPIDVSPGDYTLIIALDGYEQAYESDDANNFTALPLRVARSTADLQVTAITPVPSALSGGSVDVEWTVTNLGGATTNTGVWFDEIYLSLDPALGGSPDILLGRIQRTNPLAAGDSYTRRESLAIPAGLVGNYYLIVHTDFNDRVYEVGSDNNNNITPAAAPTAITLAPAPDLVVEAVTVPGSTFSGRTLNVTYQTRNAGTAALSTGVYETVTLSADRLSDSGDIVLGSFFEGLNLAAGESRSVTRSVRLPVGVTGSFYVLVRTDASKRVFEGDAGELNNLGFPATPMLIELAPPVDLVAGQITVPITATAGQNATISYTVTNNGPNPAVGPWTDTLYISRDQTWDINDRRFAEVVQENNVLAGTSYTGTATAPLPGLTPGDYYVIVRSDILNQIIETDETNNASASLDAFALDIPTLALDTPTTVALTQGRFNYFRLDLPDDQTFVLDVDTFGSGAAVELFARLGDVPARDRADFLAFNPLDQAPRLVIPDTSEGTYYLGIYGASVDGGTQNVSLNARLVPFSILDTDYGLAGNAGNRTLQINGARFDRTVQAHVVGNGVDLTATQMYGVNEARTYATFDLRGLAPGQYDLRITNASGLTDTLSGALQVVAGGGGTNKPRIIAPSAVGIATQQFPVTVAWGNDGLNDALAPLLYVGASNLIGDSGEERSASELTFYGAGLDDGPAGILRPDQASSRALSSNFAGLGNASSTTIIDRLVADRTRTFDWESLREGLRRFGLDDASYNAAFDQMIVRNGNTWGGYLDMLSRNANLLPPEQGSNRNPETLVELELQFAAADLGNAIVGRLFAADYAVDISGIKVSADGVDNGEGYTFETLNDGTFIMFGVAPGDYTFIARGARLIDAPAVQVTVLPGQTVRDVVLNAGPGVVTATGRVLDALTQQPMPNVFIDLLDGNTPVFTTATDPTGTYDFSLAPDGTYTVRIEADGYARTLIEGFVIEAGSDTPDIQLGRGAAASGTIDFNNTQVGAQVYILAVPDLSDPNQDYFFETTDSTFEAEGLLPGNYTFIFLSGNAAARIDNVTVGDSGVVDLGMVTLQTDLPAAGLIASGDRLANASSLELQPLAATSGTTRREFTSIIDAEKSLPNTGAELYTPGTVGQFAIDRIHGLLLNDWLKTAKFLWGNQDATFWLDFIESSPESPPARYTYYENSQIAQGYGVASGFIDEPDLQLRLDSAEQFAATYFRQNFANGTYSIEDIQRRKLVVVPFEEILPAFDSTNGDEAVRNYNYGGVFNIPGNLAGGAGSGNGAGQGGGLGQVFTDIREVTGFALLSPKGENSVKIDFHIDFSVADLVDFQPGNIGAGIEQVATRRLKFLELYGAAFDVPYILTYDLRWDDLTITRETNPNPSSPDGPPDVTWTVIRRRSGDPNDILGPDGFGPQKFVAADAPLDYTIRFENDPDLADAPAQEIFITSPLDPNLDARTFRLGDIQLSDLFVDVPDNRAFYQTRLDLTATRGVFVDVFAGVDLEKNEAFWRFTSIDPATGAIPFDPLLGLLPVNDENGLGEGFVQYSVRPLRDATTGDVVNAQATIIFDVNGPIDTPAIFNTLDATTPTSGVNPLPATSADPAFEVTWAGLDDTDGAGVSSYDVYVSIDGGAFELWLERTELSSAIYVGEAGKSYGFFVVARDHAGNEEEKPAAAEAITTVGAADPAPTVTGYQVNDGGDQRSIIDSITVQFDAPINLAAVAFELTQRGGGAVSFTVTLSADRRSATLTFVGRSLDDGIYDLQVVPAGVTSDSGTSLAGPGSFTFHRLFADFDGDGDADAADLFGFRSNLGARAGDVLYDPAYDFDGDGIIDRNDYNEARRRARISYDY